MCHWRIATMLQSSLHFYISFAFLHIFYTGTDGAHPFTLAIFRQGFGHQLTEILFTCFSSEGKVGWKVLSRKDAMNCGTAELTNFPVNDGDLNWRCWEVQLPMLGSSTAEMINATYNATCLYIKIGQWINEYGWINVNQCKSTATCNVTWSLALPSLMLADGLQGDDPAVLVDRTRNLGAVSRCLVGHSWALGSVQTRNLALDSLGLARTR